MGFGGRSRRSYRASKHWILAARAGHKDSLDTIKEGYVHGIITRNGYANILRAHQKSLDEVKSDMRDKAAALGD